MSNHIHVVVADGHPVCVKGVKLELSGIEIARVEACAFDSTQLFDVLASHACDVLICDYVMSGGHFGDGLSMLSQIRQRYPAIKLIVLTSLGSSMVVQALERQGVKGIVSKFDRSEHMLHAFHAVWRGDTYLSPRIQGALSADSSAAEAERMGKLTACEIEVVRMFLSGLSVGEIAAKFGRSKKTVSAQKRAAMRKLDVASDIELVRYGISHGLVA
ncbi:response regulator transcription factor [Achromobacter arsenitoxydans]|uniref:Two component LuxR family transcriptional regulator n=1 Tax=Achromobacter arsenitoxydans SY8 TaxID=477184 RepID=H0F1X9_9BURK|nr:response regulator transcription factor [Achromobacter arsenitoxydans]EHK67705.1 two component LuxR family transcriptional regulator [Achromobacter arsenitoxydans SY8]